MNCGDSVWRLVAWQAELLICSSGRSDCRLAKRVQTDLALKNSEILDEGCATTSAHIVKARSEQSVLRPERHQLLGTASEIADCVSTAQRWTLWA